MKVIARAVRFGLLMPRSPDPNMERSKALETDTPTDTSRKRLLNAIRMQPMDMTQCGLAAYINGVLQSARVDALTELFLAPAIPEADRKDAIETAFVKAMDKISDVLEANAKQIMVAGQAPGKLIRPNGH